MSQRPHELGGYRFPKRLRIRRTKEFERGFSRGLRVNDGYLTVWGIRNGLVYSRLGIVVGRQHGTAVRRNRLRRLLREAFRLSQDRLPMGLDLLVCPRAGVKPRLADLIDSLNRLAARLDRQLSAQRVGGGQEGPPPEKGKPD
jgi:ribonuclease P protein component